MKLFNQEHGGKARLGGLICGGLLLVAASGASAMPSIVTPDGTFDPFGGFDWSSGGSAVTTGSIVNGGAVTSVFWANAAHVLDTSSNPFATPTLDPTHAAAGGYEYTVFATLNETVSCGGALGDPCGASASFTLTGGSWTVYYDTAPNANLVTGAGITDGTQLLAGNAMSGGGTFNLLSPTSGIGIFTYTGQVTYTNSTYINPALLGTTATSTLQFGSSTTNYVIPTSEPGTSGGTQGIPGNSLIFQADANQSFTPVPEPGTLALIAGAVLGLGVLGGRRRVS